MRTALAHPTTVHFESRVALRGLRPDVLDFVLAFGVEVEAAGARSYTVIEKRLPPELAASLVARRARDWVVVTSREGVLLTCYRRKDAARFLKVKHDRRCWAPRAA